MFAKPLPARDLDSKADPKATGKTKRDKKARQAKKYEGKHKSDDDDDTPREFRRLMQFHAQRSTPQTDGKKRKRGGGEEGLDGQDGSGSTRKKKSGNGGASTMNGTTTATSSSIKSNKKADAETMPKILPGEKLSDFAARVDREMPLSEMKRSAKAHTSDIAKTRDKPLTKHDKRLRRLQSQWREDDEKIRGKEEMEREEREAEMEDQLELWKKWDTEAGKTKAKKKGAPQKKKNRGKGHRGDGGDSDDDDDDDDYDDTDPWAKLNNPDRLNKPANPLDVAKAPPQLIKPKAAFKVRGGAKVNVANVPAATGSLRRREELADERRNIVEEYRRLMAEKRQ